MKLAKALEGGNPLPSEPTVLAEFSRRFLSWLDNARLEAKTKTYYRDGWTLEGDSHRRYAIGSDYERERREARVLRLTFECQLRVKSLRRMLHKAEEWKLIAHAPKVN